MSDADKEYEDRDGVRPERSHVEGSSSSRTYESSNRDEADRCLVLAREANKSGDWVRARRLAVKSLAMFPSDSARDLVGEIDHRLSGSHGRPTADAKSRPAVKAESSDPTQPAMSSSASSNSSSSSSRRYTDSQRQVVERVLRSKDLYEVLDLKREEVRDAETVKKAYKRKALKLHPDKNFAPGAEEAFKRLSHAVQVLSDPRRRDTYDRVGEDEPSVTMRRRADVHEMTNEMSPEEIFQMFFAGAMHEPFSNVRVYSMGPRGFRPTGPTQGHGQRGRHVDLGRLIPVVIVLLGTLASNFGGNNRSVYSLNRIGPYRVEKFTHRSNLAYFIPQGPQFNEQYPEGSFSRRRLEDRIERQIMMQLRDACSIEEARLLEIRSYSKSWLISSSERQRLEELAQSFTMPNCNKLRLVRERQQPAP
mmetsp:Transcript_17095/g.35588  ORF Transcript_17095/g.35588 Transcript_17095/m.35588 type:complete len:420 (+) Transcript_17095:56-1315(+)